MSGFKQKDALLCYHVDGRKSNPITKEKFLPMVGYIRDGKVKDFLFKQFIFLPSPSYVYDENGKKAMNKAQWLDYIVKEELSPNGNIDALDAAVGEIKEKLGVTDFQADVYMSLLAPVRKTFDFGEVDGRPLDFATLGDRIAGLKWMVDESLRQFRRRNYRHVRAAGFYWFNEDLNVTEGHIELVRAVADYVREQGCETCWAPYCLAEGYHLWREAGLDFAAQQPNYFSEHLKTLPNRGTAERLKLVADIRHDIDLGITVELSDVQHEDIVVLKEYYKAGVEMGYMLDTPHIYYFNGSYLTMYQTEDPFYQSAYEDTYRFINGTLKVEEMLWE